jgi:hypothetical protein
MNGKEYKELRGLQRFEKAKLDVTLNYQSFFETLFLKGLIRISD